MSIEISMSDPSSNQELVSFYAWLCEDTDVRTHARVSVRQAEANPGEMGAGLDIIQLVVDSGFQAMNLALAYVTWRKSSQSRAQVTIEHNGIRATLHGDEPDAITTIIQVLK